MAEVLSTSSTQEVHKKSPPVHNEKDFVAKYPDLTSTPQGKKISEKHANEKNQCDVCYLEAKQEVRQVTKEQLPTIRELKLTDIRSPAGLAYYIEQSDDRWIQSLEQTIGLDSTWKILALTGAHTIVTILEAFVDILKIGEGMKNGVNAISNEDIDKWEKAWTIANGIGTDGFRALAISGPVLSKLWQVIENITISDNIFSYKSGNTFYQRWAVGNLSNEGLNITEKGKISENLYKQYSYIDTSANKEFLGQLSPERILGEWQNGIVITHPLQEWVVIKIAHPKAMHDLGVEAENHNKAFQILREWKKQNEMGEQKIPDTIKIPRIIEHFSETKWYYSMERLPWQSLHTKFLRETFANNLKNDSKELLDSLTDNQIKRRLIDVHRVSAEYVDIAIRNNSTEFTRDFLSTRLDYQKAKGYLKENWFVHPDFHGWNVMLDNNGNLYIIDFWDILKP